MTFYLFLLADTIFLSSAKIFASIFRLLLVVETISLSSGKVCNHFSFIPASGIHFSVLWEAFSQDFHTFLQVETIILSNRRHFLSFFIYCCQWESFFMQWKVFSLFSLFSNHFFAHSVYSCWW